MASLLTVHSADPETRRRGHVLAQILTVAAVLTLLLTVSNVIGQHWGYLVADLGMAAGFLGMFWLNRRGQVLAASLLFLALTVAAPFLGFDSDGLLTTTVILVLPVLIASFLLVSWSGFIVAAVMLGGLVAISEESGAVWINGLTLVLIAVLSYLFASSLERASASARRHAEDLAAANEALAVRNEEQERLLTEQSMLVEDQRKLLEAVEDLSVPVITLSEGILLLPLVGRLTDARIKAVSDAVLQSIYEQRAKTLILDLTGQHDVASQTLDTLARMLRAISLMGCQPVITGVNADLALSLSERQDLLDRVDIAGSLWQGLDMALGRRA